MPLALLLLADLLLADGLLEDFLTGDFFARVGGPAATFGAARRLRAAIFCLLAMAALDTFHVGPLLSSNGAERQELS